MAWPNSSKVDPTPGTPSLSADLAKTKIKLSLNATQHAEYYAVYAPTGTQWQHVEDIRGTKASYDYESCGWDLNKSQLKIQACKSKSVKLSFDG